MADQLQLQAGAFGFEHGNFDPQLMSFLSTEFCSPFSGLVSPECSSETAREALCNDEDKAEASSAQNNLAGKATSTTLDPGKPGFPPDIEPPRRKQLTRSAQSDLPRSGKITWNLTSDDELILQMKQERFTDVKIAEHFEQHGRVKYSHKTINSRYQRILRAIEKQGEHRLDVGLTNWTFTDDKRLMQALLKAETQVHKQIREAQAKKWAYVAKHLMSAEPDGYYPASACQKRCIALRRGTAKVPDEVACQTPITVTFTERNSPDDVPIQARAARPSHEESLQALATPARNASHESATRERPNRQSAKRASSHSTRGSKRHASHFSRAH